MKFSSLSLSFLALMAGTAHAGEFNCEVGAETVPSEWTDKVIVKAGTACNIDQPGTSVKDVIVEEGASVTIDGATVTVEKVEVGEGSSATLKNGATAEEVKGEKESTLVISDSTIKKLEADEGSVVDLFCSEVTEDVKGKKLLTCYLSGQPGENDCSAKNVEVSVGDEETNTSGELTITDCVIGGDIKVKDSDLFNPEIERNTIMGNIDLEDNAIAGELWVTDNHMEHSSIYIEETNKEGGTCDMTIRDNKGIKNLVLKMNSGENLELEDNSLTDDLKVEENSFLSTDMYSTPSISDNEGAEKCQIKKNKFHPKVDISGNLVSGEMKIEENDSPETTFYDNCAGKYEIKKNEGEGDTFYCDNNAEGKNCNGDDESASETYMVHSFLKFEDNAMTGTGQCEESA